MSDESEQRGATLRLRGAAGVPRDRTDSDEKYVLDVVEGLLEEACQRQKRFDDLVGDTDLRGRRRKLPVDAYFPSRKLIVEYRERQHYQPVPFMDRRMTVSGVTRGEQRQIYDARKEQWAEEHGLAFLVIPYTALSHASNGRLDRNTKADTAAILSLLKDVGILPPTKFWRGVAEDR